MDSSTRRMHMMLGLVQIVHVTGTSSGSVAAGDSHELESLELCSATRRSRCLLKGTFPPHKTSNTVVVVA